MQESKDSPGRLDSLIWRLAQVVLVLAAAYLYFMLRSFGGLLQRDRLIGNPHTTPLIQAVLVGLGIGICIGLALKDLRRGFTFTIEWPTLAINIGPATVFVAVSIALNIQATTGVALVQGAIKDAVTLDPLLPFVWIGLALTTILRARS